MSPQTSELLKNIHSEMDRIPSVIRPSIQFQLLHPEAKPPSKAHPTDAGWDLYAHSSKSMFEWWECKTGVAVAIPEGYVGILKERSSIRGREIVLLGGVIDPGYTGEITVNFMCKDKCEPYGEGERCCQLLILPCPLFTMVQVDKLPESARGSRGFGSSGR